MSVGILRPVMASAALLVASHSGVRSAEAAVHREAVHLGLAPAPKSFDESLDATYPRDSAGARQADARARLLVFACVGIGVVFFVSEVMRRQRRSAAMLAALARDLENALATLRIEQAREREVIEMRSRFIALVSHEFRTPLSVIQSSTDLIEALEQKGVTDKSGPYFRRIADAVAGMVEMLDSVLAVSKAEAGKVEVRRAPLDVPAFCKELVESIEQGAKGKARIELTIEGDWARARFDGEHLRHALSNLLSNARKYSPDGGAVRFTASAEGDKAVFVVADEGIGISSADIARLFQLFQRGSNVGSIAGTGLGLAIVKRSVEACGGTVDVASEIGKGTRFTVRLPLGQDDV